MYRKYPFFTWNHPETCSKWMFFWEKEKYSIHPQHLQKSCYLEVYNQYIHLFEKQIFLPKTKESITYEVIANFKDMISFLLSLKIKYYLLHYLSWVYNYYYQFHEKKVCNHNSWFEKNSPRWKKEFSYKIYNCQEVFF